MFLEFVCWGGGQFYVKMPNFKIGGRGQVPTYSDPNILGPSPWSEVSKKVCHAPVGQKLKEGIYFLETGCFGPRAVPSRPADLTPPPKNNL
jgi:hypothetical protein